MPGVRAHHPGFVTLPAHARTLPAGNEGWTSRVNAGIDGLLKLGAQVGNARNVDAPTQRVFTWRHLDAADHRGLSVFLCISTFAVMPSGARVILRPVTGPLR